jgi:hypothetical protein
MINKILYFGSAFFALGYLLWARILFPILARRRVLKAEGRDVSFISKPNLTSESDLVASLWSRQEKMNNRSLIAAAWIAFVILYPFS